MVRLSTVVSLLDTLERGILLHFFSSTLICNKKRKESQTKSLSSFPRVCFFPPTVISGNRKDQSSPQTSNKYLLKHPVHKILHSQSSCSHRKRNQSPMSVFIVLQIGTHDLQPGELLRLPGYLFLSSKHSGFLTFQHRHLLLLLQSQPKGSIHIFFMTKVLCHLVVRSPTDKPTCQILFCPISGETLTHKQQ